MTHSSSGHYIDQQKSPDNGHTRGYHSAAGRCDRTACDGVAAFGLLTSTCHKERDPVAGGDEDALGFLP